MVNRGMFYLGLTLLGTGDYGAGRESAWWFIMAATGALFAGIGFRMSHE